MAPDSLRWYTNLIAIFLIWRNAAASGVYAR